MIVKESQFPTYKENNQLLMKYKLTIAQSSFLSPHVLFCITSIDSWTSSIEMSFECSDLIEFAIYEIVLSLTVLNW